MLDNSRVWKTRKAYIGLQMQLAALRGRRPGTRSPAQQARIRRLDTLITNASVDAQPADDGVAEPGMVLTIRHDNTGQTETFLLGLRGAEDVDLEVYSPHSPLGTALAGAHAGEQRTYHSADGAPRDVTLIHATPYGRRSKRLRGPAA